jgi:hypothetical protein
MAIRARHGRHGGQEVGLDVPGGTRFSVGLSLESQQVELHPWLR